MFHHGESPCRGLCFVELVRSAQLQRCERHFGIVHDWHLPPERQMHSEVR